MQPPIPAALFALLLFLGMLILLEVGHRLGAGQGRQESEGERGSRGAIEGAVFALFGLLMAFTFSGAALRFNEKRMLIAEEANAIETAYLRLHMAPQEAQPALRELFRSYLDSRLETYRKLPDMESAELEMAKSQLIRDEIWIDTVAATRHPSAHPAAGWLLIPAVNNMIDIATTRTMALQVHPPSIIYLLLFGLGLVCSLMAGYRMANSKHRGWLHILGFTFATVIVVYVILDIEYPRTGLFRLEAADHLLVGVRKGMK